MPLSLTLAPITDGQNADAADVVVPFNQVQTFANGLETSINGEITNRTTAVANLKSGADPFDILALGNPPAIMNIAGGHITVTQSIHVIDTEGSASTDDLVTILGAVSGHVLMLRAQSSARQIKIRHGVGNISTYSGADVVLDLSSKMALFVYDNSAPGWFLVSAGAPPLLLHNNSTPLTQIPLSAFGLPDRTLVTAGFNAPRLDVAPGIMVTRRVAIVASGTTVQADLVAAPTLSGTGTVAHQADTTYVSIASAASAGSAGGWSTTFDLFQRRHDPYIDMMIRTPSLITLGRWFWGMWSAGPTNAADPAGSAIGFRFDPVAGDTGIRALLDDGTTLSLSSDLNTMQADTNYRLRIRVDGSGGGVAYFSIDGGAELAMSTSMPGASTNLGLLALVYCTTSAARSTVFARADVGWK